MKITDPDVIKNGEKDLIDAVTDDLDLDVVRQILEKKIAATALAAKGGQIVVHNNEIAFKLDFDLNLSGSLMFDRDGNYISENDAEDSSLQETETEDADMDSTQFDADSLDMGDSEEEKPEEIREDMVDESEQDLSENIENNPDDDLDDDLKIDLPDYSLDEDEFSDPLMAESETEPANDEQEDLDDFEPMDDIPLLEDESLEDDIIPDDLITDGLTEDETIEDDTIQDDLVDDDINDILKESQEFWDQKKDS